MARAGATTRSDGEIGAPLHWITVQEFFDYLLKHGYGLLFAFVLMEQLGLPLPASPLLIAMGALIALGHFHWAGAMAVAVAGSLAADYFWYALGRNKGHSVLKFLCKISLEPDSCVSNTRSLFKKWGAGVLLICKFVPGLNTAAPPLAGISRMSRSRFLLFDALGALLWVGSFLGLGFLFHKQIERAAEWVSALGLWLLAILGGGLVLYWLFKRWQRQRFIRSLTVARIDPEQALPQVTSGDLLVLDLRSADEYESSEFQLPGAIWIDRRNLEDQLARLPKDRDVLLYCT
jgi:membrane protein DedA with SNARE-associated domain